MNEVAIQEDLTPLARARYKHKKALDAGEHPAADALTTEEIAALPKSERAKIQRACARRDRKSK